MEISCSVRILMALTLVYISSDIWSNATVVYFCRRGDDKVDIVIRVRAF